jgi:hypothetical protein
MDFSCKKTGGGRKSTTRRRSGTGSERPCRI